VIAWWSAAAFAADLVVRGGTVLPVSGPPIADGAVLVRDGRIVAVGPASSIPVPAGAEVISGAFVLPGLVDAFGTVGLTGELNQPFDQDHAETSDTVWPALRVLDAWDPGDPLVTWVRERGVTTVMASPSPGMPVGARSLVVQTLPGSTDVAALVPDAMVVFSLGQSTEKRFPTRVATRMGTAATIRQALADAVEAQKRRGLPLGDRPSRDLGDEALVELLEGRRTAVFVADKVPDLLTALRIADEFDLHIVLAGAAEAWRIPDVIEAAGVPVILGPTMARSYSDPEGHDRSFANAAVLADAGVPIAFSSGFEDYVPKVRVVLYEAAVAAANGLGSDRAIQALTLGAARILGIEGTTGSLEPGKSADLVVFDGDPFEYTSHVCSVIVRGTVQSRTCF
jgi:imidazolonepropionase-like amidohydrolase